MELQAKVLSDNRLLELDEIEQEVARFSVEKFPAPLKFVSRRMGNVLAVQATLHVDDIKTGSPAAVSATWTLSPRGILRMFPHEVRDALRLLAQRVVCHELDECLMREGDHALTAHSAPPAKLAAGEISGVGVGGDNDERARRPRHAPWKDMVVFAAGGFAAFAVDQALHLPRDARYILLPMVGLAVGLLFTRILP